MTVLQFAALQGMLGDLKNIQREVLLILLGDLDEFYRDPKVVGEYRFTGYKDGLFEYEMATKELEDSNNWILQRVRIGLGEEGKIAALNEGRYGCLSWSEQWMADDYVRALRGAAEDNDAA